jgi:hypothetical protein
MIIRYPCNSINNFPQHHVDTLAVPSRRLYRAIISRLRLSYMTHCSLIPDAVVSGSCQYGARQSWYHGRL